MCEFVIDRAIGASDQGKVILFFVGVIIYAERSIIFTGLAPYRSFHATVII